MEHVAQMAKQMLKQDMLAIFQTTRNGLLLQRCQHQKCKQISEPKLWPAKAACLMSSASSKPLTKAAPSCTVAGGAPALLQ
jgi:hypothetical protein